MSVPAVLGVADHNGWAICVTVAAARGVPVVVDRRRIELVEPGLPSQPYHHETVGMPLAEGERLVVRVRASVRRTAGDRLLALRDELRPRFALAAMTLRVPPLAYVPVTVAEAHASYPVMCRADAMLYHDALCAAARQLDLPLVQQIRGQEIERAAECFGASVEAIEQFLRAAGDSMGPPWRQEHRLAAAAAMTALAAHTPLALDG